MTAPLRALKVRGPYRGASGYEHHVREFVRALTRAQVAVQLVDFPDWAPAPPIRRAPDPWFERLALPVAAEIALHFTMPHQVVPFPRLANVNFTMFEADRIPSWWVTHSNSHDLVIVPTESSRSAWTHSGVAEERLAVCPLGVDPQRFAGQILPLPLRGQNGVPIAEYRTRFLNVARFDPRKNPEGLLRAWLRATTRRDDAVLLLKFGRYAPSWFAQLRFLIAAAEVQTGRRLEEAAPVHLLWDTLSDAEMPRLYAAATHYISMSHGEGWDLPMMEAAAGGLSLIAPQHSAYTAYLDATVAQMIPAAPVTAKPWGGEVYQVLFDGAMWWQPDEHVAAELIRAAIDGTEAPKAPLRTRVLAGYSWDQAAARLIELLSHLAAEKQRQ